MKKTIQIKIGTTNFTINYPTIKGKLEIENLKILLSNGLYGEIARSAHISGNEILDAIDAFSVLQICCPDLQLNVAKFEALDDLISANYVYAYKKNIFPWFQSVQKEIDEAMKSLYGTEEQAK